MYRDYSFDSNVAVDISSQSLFKSPAIVLIFSPNSIYWNALYGEKSNLKVHESAQTFFNTTQLGSNILADPYIATFQLGLELFIIAEAAHNNSSCFFCPAFTKLVFQQIYLENADWDSHIFHL